jgi:hypothetical protein
VKLALAVFTDGRDECLAETIESANTKLRATWCSKTIFDDTGDIDHVKHLKRQFPDFTVLATGPGKQGFGGAIASAWRTLFASEATHVFHLEDDFVFEAPIFVSEMVHVLDIAPNVQQVALKRQPWGDEPPNGFMGQWPTAYMNQTVEKVRWTEQRLFFTTNPSVYRRDLMVRGWPEVPQSEKVFGNNLFAENEHFRCAFLGHKDDAPLVHHIGANRVGTGY